MQIQVINVDAVKKGKFDAVEVNYKNLFDGKVAMKPVMKFHGAFDVLKTASKDQKFTVTAEKDKNGYWIWTSASEGVEENVGRVVQKGREAPRSTFETPEERARRQVYIARQSSLERALHYYVSKDPDFTPDDVIALANKFATWVLDVAPDRSFAASIESMRDDVPA